MLIFPSLDAPLSLFSLERMTERLTPARDQAAAAVPRSAAGCQRINAVRWRPRPSGRRCTAVAHDLRADLDELLLQALIDRVFGEDALDLPALARTALRPFVAQLMQLRLQIKTIEKELLAWHRTS